MVQTFSSKNGHIEVITGSMFSGKTEELIRRIERADIAGKDVEVFTPKTDDRYGEDVIGSHKGNEKKAKIVDPEKDSLKNRASDNLDVIAVDEANFFNENIVGEVRELANQGLRVIVSGTDQTFRGDPFEPLPQLMAEAEKVDKLNAVCSKCGEPATRNQRLIDGEPAHEDDPTIMVGADESYEARCRECHELRTD